MRIVKKSALWVITVLYLILVFGFVDNRYENQLCNRIKITVQDSLNSRFISSREIIRSIDRKGIKYLGIHLDELNLTDIENAVRSNQLIKDCRAYTGINGTLHLEILQRKPLVRIIEASGRSYYLDQEGNVLNLSSRYTPRVLVVNGKINTAVKVGKPVNIFQLDSTKSALLLRDIHELASYIQSETFWNAQIVQVYVNNSGEFELIPRVGPHIIILGKLTDYREKFDKLELFYKEGLNNVGWNHYVKINLKYKNQIVCSKI
jgi:cell division protein FtsQ